MANQSLEIGGQNLTYLSDSSSYKMQGIMSCVGLVVLHNNIFQKAVGGVGLHFIHGVVEDNLVGFCDGKFTKKGESLLRNIKKYIFSDRYNKSVEIHLVVGMIDPAGNGCYRVDRSSKELKENLQAFLTKMGKEAKKKIKFNTIESIDGNYEYRSNFDLSQLPEISPTVYTYTDEREIKEDQCINMCSFRKYLHHINYGRETKEDGEPESE